MKLTPFIAAAGITIFSLRPCPTAQSQLPVMQAQSHQSIKVDTAKDEFNKADSSFATKSDRLLLSIKKAHKNNEQIAKIAKEDKRAAAQKAQCCIELARPMVKDTVQGKHIKKRGWIYRAFHRGR